MACKRCPEHEIKYPTTESGCPVEGCSAKQESHFHLPHDGDWEQQARALSLTTMAGYPDETGVPMRMETTKSGWVAVDATELARCGYDGAPNRADTLIRSKGTYYETVAFDAPRDRWILQAVDVKAWAAKIPVFDG